MATEQSVLALIRAARPQFGSAFDKAAYAVHAAFSAAGYVLHATGLPALAEDALSVSSKDEVGMDNWKDVEGNYAFVYSNPEKGSKKVLVKCLVMNDTLLVDVLKEGGSPLHLELNVAEYVQEDAGANYGSQYKNLRKLVENVNKKLLSKLDAAPASSSSTENSRGHIGASSREERDRLRVGPYNFQDPYPPSNPGYTVPPVPPFVGGDVYPGMYPSRGVDFRDGRELVGPDDPIFFGGPNRNLRFPGGQPGVPPGARFDPYGPPNVPGFEPGRFARRSPTSPGGGLHPDLQHFHNGSDFI